MSVRRAVTEVNKNGVWVSADRELPELKEPVLCIVERVEDFEADSKPDHCDEMICELCVRESKDYSIQVEWKVFGTSSTIHVMRVHKWWKEFS